MEHLWSQNTWKTVEPIYQQITTHPFLTKLMDGSLEKEKFLFYLNQDALYLDDFGKVLAGLAVKNQNRRHVEVFLTFAANTISVERALHQSYLGQIDAKAAPSPTCLLYTSFMHRQLALAPLEVAAASVLPCFWVYKNVGDFILSHEQKPGNAYQNWINTYGGEEFGAAVAQAIAIIDELAAETTPENRAEMTHAFKMATKMEWMFWDSAWKMESWPV